MRTALDVIIMGAGPAGSSAAILLARAGWSVALVEKQRFPRRKVCGECLAASNLPLLDSLGIGVAFNASAGPELRQVALMHADRTLVARLPQIPHDPHPWGRALGRETLDTLLLAQARRAGVQVLQPWSAQGAEGEPGDWRCVIRDMDSSANLTLHAPVMMDAHGSWEALSSSRKVNRRAVRGADLLAFKANFLQATLTEGLLPILMFDGGYGGMVVADDRVTTLACCIRRDRLEALRRASPGWSAGDVVEAMLKRTCLGVREALQGATRLGPWLAAGPLEPGIRLRADDGVYRIGNAAAEAHPIIGEGMSMALQSAWLLCTHLLAGDHTRDLTDRAWQRDVGRAYAAEWRRQFAPRLRLAAAFAYLAMRPSGAGALMSAVQLWPGLLTAGARWSGKTRCAADAPVLALASRPV